MTGAATTVLPVRRALLSVYDKTGLADFAGGMAAAGVELVSSGGTATALRAEGLAVTDVSTVTGSPEMLGGRVKTLHPAILGGILADPSQPDHREDLESAGIEPFQLVVCNLYPFSATVARRGVTEAEAVEQIDVGGPTMIRSAAKNHAWVGVVTSTDQYAEVAGAVAAGGLSFELRKRLARSAFFHTASYDAAIVGWLERSEPFPERLVLPLVRAQPLRYGENPHQAAAAYRDPASDGWWSAARVLQGKQLSFNNLVDAEAAWRLASEFDAPTVVVVKHTNPCGVAEAATVAAAFDAAWECDPLSAFGSVIASSRPVDEATATLVAERFVEVLIAPEVTPAAAEILAKRKNLRVLEAPPPGSTDLDLRRLENGLLVQARDRVEVDRSAWTVASLRQPDDREWAQLILGWRVVAHTKSNAVVVVRDKAAVGVGAGDQSRVGAAERALGRAGDRAVGGVAASDAFFPFRDGIDLLADAGVTAIVQQGGSRRDDEVIAAADERGIAMVMTATRHFRH